MLENVKKFAFERFGKLKRVFAPHLRGDTFFFKELLCPQQPSSIQFTTSSTIQSILFPTILHTPPCSTLFM